MLFLFFTATVPETPKATASYVGRVPHVAYIGAIGLTSASVSGFGLRGGSVAIPKAKGVAYEIPAPTAIVSAPRR